MKTVSVFFGQIELGLVCTIQSPANSRVGKPVPQGFQIAIEPESLADNRRISKSITSVAEKREDASASKSSRARATGLIRLPESPVIV